MTLYKEILIKLLEKESLQVSFPTITLQPDELVSLACYKALNDIKAILSDDTLDDKNCFRKIEDIVTLFEDLGSDAGLRHDF